MFTRLMHDHAARRTLLRVIVPLSLSMGVLDRRGPHWAAVVALALLTGATGLLLAVWLERSRRGLD